MSLGVFSRPCAFVANPRSGSEAEKIRELAAHGFTLSLNVRENGWDDWRMLAHAHGVDVFPWQQCFFPADVADLVNFGVEWMSRAIVVNVEKESETTCTPTQVAAELVAWGGEAAIQTSPWTNAPGPNPKHYWTPLENHPAMPEAYLNNARKWLPSVVTARALTVGFKAAIPTFGYGVWADGPLPVTPDLYFTDWPAGSYGIWTIDQMPAEDIGKWAHS